MKRLRSPWFSSAALAALACASCAAQRELVILSDPSGAVVRMDDKIVGTTPYREAFEAYGTRRITLYRQGFRPTSKLVVLTPPWYGRFPFDIFSEVLLPVGWKDKHREELKLEPESGSVSEPDLEAVLGRAESLRLATPAGPRPKIPKIDVPAEPPR